MSCILLGPTSTTRITKGATTKQLLNVKLLKITPTNNHKSISTRRRISVSSSATNNPLQRGGYKTNPVCQGPILPRRQQFPHQQLHLQARTRTCACIQTERRWNNSLYNIAVRRNSSTSTTTSTSKEASISPSTSSSIEHGVVEEPTNQILRRVAFTTGLPFLGFGFMDNAILIIAGDAIDTSLGVALGISTLCAAAIGNIISDLAGIGAGAYIEDFCATVLKLPVPKLNGAQRQLRSVRIASFFGMAVGMTIGCIVGMLPLVFIDPNKAEKLRKKARLESLYQDVVTEAKTLVGAESTCLYLRVDKNDNNANDVEQKHRADRMKGNYSILHDEYHPSVNGQYLYAMYYLEPHNNNNDHRHRHQQHYDSHHHHYHHHQQQNNDSNAIHNLNNNNDNITTIIGDDDDDDNIDDDVIAEVNTSPLPPSSPTVSTSRILSVGKGIVSRAILTGTTWNIVGSLFNEPDFYPLSIETCCADEDDIATSGGSNKSTGSSITDHGHFRDLVVVPILDAKGTPIAVLEAMNKKYYDDDNDDYNNNDGDGFSDVDVEMLSSLASHVSVSLQSIYRDSEEDEEMRLRDTIRILKNGKDVQRSKSNACNNNSNDDNDQHNSGGRENRQLEIGSTSSGIVATKPNSTKRLFPD